jgi:hypothetical protein
MLETIVTCAAGLGALLLAVGGVVALRYLKYRETLARIERGLPVPEGTRDGKETLRWGIGITAVGIALCIGLYPLGRQFPYPLGLGPWMLLGLVPLFFGLSLILIYVLTLKNNGK